MSVFAVAELLGGAKVLGKEINSDFDFLVLAEKGVPKATVQRLADSHGIEVKELVKYLPVT
ncbi:MAG: hypothetical protein ACK4GN_13075 [Runella sp.]